MGLFRKAVKSESKLRMAIAGPSGSGKTYTALAIGTALANGGPVAVVDTEHGSASKYADLFDFDVAEMSAPFHPDKFVRAVTEAQEAGYAVVILDSISHAWSGTGGVLDVVDEAAKRSQSRNSFTAWKEGTPLQNRMIDALVQSNIHVIVTMRSKTEYILADNGKGKQEPRKVGMAPVQRDQFEYEFDVVFDMDVENNGIVTKTRCPALTSRVFAKPGADVANILREWLTGAPAAPSKPKPAAASNGTQPATPGVEADVDMGMGGDDYPFEDAQTEAEQPERLSAKTLKRLHALGTEVYGDAWDAKRPELVQAATKGAATSASDLTETEAAKLIDGMNRKRALVA